MSLHDILLTIDEEIARLTQARALLAGKHGQHEDATEGNTASRKYVLSPEARERIANAQRKRWAAQRKAER